VDIPGVEQRFIFADLDGAIPKTLVTVAATGEVLDTVAVVNTTAGADGQLGYIPTV
jgi:hypothetical protein